MDYLKEGIGLRAMAQRDPLVEYQREGYDMFMGMLDGLKEESVGCCSTSRSQAAPAARRQVAPMAAPPNLAAVRRRGRREGAGRAAPAPTRAEASRPQAAPAALRVKGIDDETSRPLTYTGPSEDGSAEVQRQGGGGGNGDAGADGGRRARAARASRGRARVRRKARRRKR